MITLHNHSQQTRYHSVSGLFYLVNGQ